MVTKKELRKKYRSQREKLTRQDMHRLLAAMVDPFREIPFTLQATAMSYAAIEEKKEVSPVVFEQLYWEDYQPRGFCYPAADFLSGDMTAFMDDEALVWEEAEFGLTQPGEGTRILPAEIDVVFVPLLAFDNLGHRLGYGKGFYDRFLQKCRPDVQKIGFCWFDPETCLPEIGSHDVPLNYCVTPHKLYVF